MSFHKICRTLLEQCGVWEVFDRGAWVWICQVYPSFTLLFLLLSSTAKISNTFRLLSMIEMNQNLFPLCFNTFCGDCFQFFVWIISGKYFFQVVFSILFVGENLKIWKYVVCGQFWGNGEVLWCEAASASIEVWNHTLGKWGSKKSRKVCKTKENFSLFYLIDYVWYLDMEPAEKRESGQANIV